MAISTIHQKSKYDRRISATLIEDLPLNINGASSFLLIISTMGGSGLDGNHSIYILDVSWNCENANLVKLIGDNINLSASISNNKLTVTTDYRFTRCLVFPMGSALFLGGLNLLLSIRLGARHEMKSTTPFLK